MTEDNKNLIWIQLLSYIFKDIFKIPDLTMVGGKEKLWFLDALKCSIPELILCEKMSLKLKLIYIFQNFWIWVWRSRCPIALCTMKIFLNSPVVGDQNVLKKGITEEFILCVVANKSDPDKNELTNKYFCGHWNRCITEKFITLTKNYYETKALLCT